MCRYNSLGLNRCYPNRSSYAVSSTDPLIIARANRFAHDTPRECCCDLTTAVIYLVVVVLCLFCGVVCDDGYNNGWSLLRKKQCRTSVRESDASSEQDVEILCFANKTLKPSSSAFFLFFIILLNYTSYSHIHATMIFLLWL